jgi:hypothetical protein
MLLNSSSPRSRRLNKKKKLADRNRRTKAELTECGYYTWLEDCKALRGKKKSGEKLTPAEKEVMRSTPTPERPYTPSRVVKESLQPKPQRNKKSTYKIDFGLEKEFEVKANHFFCEVKKQPHTDEECLLFCAVKECPFNGKGYFRSKGIKF